MFDFQASVSFEQSLKVLKGGNTIMIDLKSLEEKEKNTLFNLGMIFKDSLEDFSTSLDKSLKYLDKIVFPIIMASKEEKSYNPFSEIIEKYVLHILIMKLKKQGYYLLPLGYSSDLTLENDEHILNIDIKTANIDNPSDFSNTVNLGINQMTHIAKLRLNRSFLPEPFFVYPSIPPFYKINNSDKKLILTFGLIFIYPAYRDLIENIREDYHKIFKNFNEKIKDILTKIISKKFKITIEAAQKIMYSKPKKSSYSKNELITESIIRGVFIHEQEREKILKKLNFSEQERKNLSIFSEKIVNFIEELRKRDIKPAAIIAISIPNGLLKQKYLHKFVSGKDYGRSSRYHYEDGIFEIIKEQTNKEFPRVIFIDLKKEYTENLKRYFRKIFLIDYAVKEL